MPLRPFEYFKEYLRDKVERDQKNTELIHTQTDGFITWLIGFSFTGLLLAVANINNLQLKYRSPTKPVIICLLVTIVLGIAFRYISYLTLLFQKNLDDYFYGLLSEKDVMPIEVDEYIYSASFEEIIRSLKDDFDEEINFPNQLTPEQKEIELPKLREHYSHLCEYARKSYEIFVNHFAEIHETAYKIDKSKTVNFLKHLSDNVAIGYNLNMWTTIKSILYTMCLLSFLIAVLMTSFSIIFIK